MTQNNEIRVTAHQFLGGGTGFDDELTFKAADPARDGSFVVSISTKGVLPDTFEIYRDVDPISDRPEMVRIPMSDLDITIAKLQKLAQIRDEWDGKKD